MRISIDARFGCTEGINQKIKDKMMKRFPHVWVVLMMVVERTVKYNIPPKSPNWFTGGCTVGCTAAGVTAPQIIMDKGNFILDFRHLGFCTSLLFL